MDTINGVDLTLGSDTGFINTTTDFINGTVLTGFSLGQTSKLAITSSQALFGVYLSPDTDNTYAMGQPLARWAEGYYGGVVYADAGFSVQTGSGSLLFQSPMNQNFDFHDGAASPTDIRIFNDYNGATSNEWIEIGWKEKLTKGFISTKANGAGNPNTDLFITAGGHLEMGSSPGYQVYVSVSGTRTWRFRAGGQLEPQTASTVDLGSPTNTVRYGYFDELRSPTDVDIVLNPQGTGTVTSTTDINGASPTEMSYLSGATSNIQDQLDNQLLRAISWTVNLGGKTNASFRLIGEQSDVTTGETGDYTTDFGVGNQHIAILVNSITTGGDIVITGTSVTEGGATVTTSDTETITVDTTAGQLYQTSKKWLEITNIDITTGTIVSINYDVQRLGYFDAGNNNFTLLGMRCDVLVNGNLSDFALIGEKVQDDGSGKCSIVTFEDYGHDSTVSGGAYFDGLRTGADDRSYTMGSNLAASDDMVVYKNTDYTTYFTSDENVIEGATKDEGVILRFEGRTAAGAPTNISSIETATVTFFYIPDP
jgi:hypothetical protein